jgi:signal transduction histidine kinase
MRNRVGIVEAEIGRLGRLLTEFLELARPRGPQIGGVDLAKIVEGVLELEEEALAVQNVKVVTELEPAAPVAADPEKVKQIVINLVANSIDALRGGGTLTLRVTGGDESPRVEVIDDGPGIEASVLESVFDPFFTTKPAGTGLGLAIVRKIVDQHGGSIAIDSAPGKGTRVTVGLPKWTPSGKTLAPAR